MLRIEILKSFSAAQLRPSFSLIAFAGEQTGTANMCLRTFGHLLSIFKCIGHIPISYHIMSYHIISYQYCWYDIIQYDIYVWYTFKFDSSYKLLCSSYFFSKIFSWLFHFYLRIGGAVEAMYPISTDFNRFPKRSEVSSPTSPASIPRTRGPTQTPSHCSWFQSHGFLGSLIFHRNEIHTLW